MTMRRNGTQHETTFDPLVFIQVNAERLFHLTQHTPRLHVLCLLFLLLFRSRYSPVPLTSMINSMWSDTLAINPRGKERTSIKLSSTKLSSCSLCRNEKHRTNHEQVFALRLCSTLCPVDDRRSNSSTSARNWCASNNQSYCYRPFGMSYFGPWIRSSLCE